MGYLSLIKSMGWVLGSLFLAACSGTPDATGDKEKQTSSATGGSSARSAANPGGAALESSAVAGARAIQITTEPAECRRICLPGECGPIANECGEVIQCGGCVAPEICGGAGIPSRCGSPLASCVPTTCAALGATCGLQSDGCGGILDCWSAAAKTSAILACEIPGFVCVDGTCRSTAPECKRRTCADYAGKTNLCGPVGDGCGGTLECGFVCKSDEACGVEELGKCGKIACTPLTCDEALQNYPPGYCGIVPDGCGGIVGECQTGCAVAGEICGGAGEPDICGPGTSACEPQTAEACGDLCGSISDGCGGVIQCATCTAPEVCGVKVASHCDSVVCRPRTCASLDATCGKIADGCGAELDCGTCVGPATCGGGGTPNRCGGAVCVPLTKAQVCLPGRCGQQSDGCGGVLDCGGCTIPNTCGGGGTPSVCGAPSCTKRTCDDVGANCGKISDGCGGIIASCGTCTSPEICGGLKPSVCGVGSDPNCTGLCAAVDTSCALGHETRLTGKVYAPNGSDPIYNAMVYVPNGPLPPIPSGPSCDRCQDEDLGQPIVAAVSAPDGSFTLRNVPAGVAFPLVVKIGKWRRVVTIPALTRCTSVPLDADDTRLPRSMTDASESENLGYVNIPHIAVVTGFADSMECVLRTMGVADSEFTLPTGSGRIHIYYGNGGFLTKVGTYAKLADLFAPKGTTHAINDYDMAILDCKGLPWDDEDAYDPILRNWANAGGRVFASHYSHTYLQNNGDYANAAVWEGAIHKEPVGIVDTTTPHGRAFNAWLGATRSWHPSHGSGFVAGPFNEGGYVQDVKPGSERILYTDPSVLSPGGEPINQHKTVQQFRFQTPFGAADDQVCGRVAYSAFHVLPPGDKQFPGYCPSPDPSRERTSQEKILMFALIDLAACVGEFGTPSTCTPLSCEQQNAKCGIVADGCGGVHECGPCTAPESCGGGGVPNQCGNACTQTTCGAQGANCGVVADGCGGTLTCGDCKPPAVCGGSGLANICGRPACVPRTCNQVGAECGSISDGCGGTIDCGTCTEPETCGGGGTPNACGRGTCVPVTCGAAVCGFVGDGCGGTVACGTCAEGETCLHGVCVGGICTPRSCASASATCGYIGDGCGGVVNCGPCESPQVCGGAGIPSQCGGNCAPRSCEEANAECGAISDGCGGIKQCGVCPPGESCGGGGVPNQCAAGSCSARNCAAVDAECGKIGDGCGSVLDCGPCAAPLTCGGAGVPNKCGTGGCVPLTCADQNANCGPVADGCGGLLDCGTCPNGQTCGGGGIPSRCGGTIIL